MRVRHSAVRSRNGVMSREQWEHKRDKVRHCNRPARPLGVSIAQPPSPYSPSASL
jgi:hypothetical protein